jgi:hypothetical protein
VRTDELIDQLSTRAPRLRPGVATRLAWAALAGSMAAVALTVAWLGIRPDLRQAAETAAFWMKLGYGAALAAGGFLAVERLSRPGGSGRRGLALALVVFLTLAVLGVSQLLLTAPDERLALWLGRSWRRCPTNVLTLALPMLAVSLVVVRGLAPTRAVLAGGATGLFAGGLAMVAYGLHCPETEPAFVATWYTLGALLTSALGAVLGPLVLRWR